MVAVGAVFCDWFSVRDTAYEDHLEACKFDFWVCDGEEELTGEESTCGIGRGSVEDERR